MYNAMIMTYHCAGHMTKMAAMPIYGKNPFFPKTIGRRPWKLVCSIGALGQHSFFKL